MGVFYHEEPPNPSKKCKFLAATIKDALSNCHTCRGGLSTSSPAEECPTSDIDDEQEVVVSAVRSRAMEKTRQKSFVMTDSFSCLYSPKTGELFVTSKVLQRKDDGDDAEDGDVNEREEFFSVGSCFSCYSSVLSREAFFSVKTNFSRCSSLNGLEFPDFRRRSIIQELLCHCEGWPFGLCKKAFLLPPLPKSPSESWSWRKGNRTFKMPHV